ncbi:MAG: outer membrane beta-barrel protein [Burkholderiales bacterium]
MTARICSSLAALCALAYVALAAADPASAQRNGYYAGASVGLTTVDLCDNLGGVGFTGCDHSDTGLKLFGGARINRNFAVELGWADLGAARASGPGGSARIDVDGLQVAAVGILPLSSRTRAFGKAGLYVWNTSGTGAPSDNGTDLMLGLGGAWSLTPQVDVRGEWERFDVGSNNVDLFSVGLQYNF